MFPYQRENSQYGRNTWKQRQYLFQLQAQTGKLNMEKLFCGEGDEDVGKPQVKVGKLNRSNI